MPLLGIMNDSKTWNCLGSAQTLHTDSPRARAANPGSKFHPRYLEQPAHSLGYGHQLAPVLHERF